MSYKQCRFGIVGFGAWGQKVAQRILASKMASLEWIIERECWAEYAFNDERKVPGFENLGIANRSSDVDVIGIFTPGQTHLDLATKALELSKSVWITKPVVMTVEEWEILNDRKGQAFIYVDHTYLFSPGFVRLSEFVKSKKKSILSINRRSVGHFKIPKESSLLHEVFYHDFYIADYLFPHQTWSARYEIPCGRSKVFRLILWAGGLRYTSEIEFSDERTIREWCVKEQGREIAFWNSLDGVKEITILGKKIFWNEPSDAIAKQVDLVSEFHLEKNSPMRDLRLHQSFAVSGWITQSIEKILINPESVELGKVYA